MHSSYSGKRVLVTGGTGMIGRALVKMLLDDGAIVRVASMDDPRLATTGTDYRRSDLRHLTNCLDVCRGQEIVFHVAGIKGSPMMAQNKPASFLVPLLQFNTNMMEAARQEGVDRYLYTSTIGVYGPSETFTEDLMWRTPPSKNDWSAGWAKRMGELQAEVYQKEYGWNKISIVRPANVYGEYDNYDSANAMVIPSLIRRVVDGENPLVVWGDGSSIRDFVHTDDVARGMMRAVEYGVNVPINLGSGKGVTIREIAEAVVSCKGGVKIEWDTSKPTGDKKRLMNIDRAKELLDWHPIVPIDDGIRSTFEWYRDVGYKMSGRYNVFSGGV